ncbi:hypothetical protein AAE478_000644 [Parahypoxylon ruwenzoriense]
MENSALQVRARQILSTLGSRSEMVMTISIGHSIKRDMFFGGLAFGGLPSNRNLERLSVVQDLDLDCFLK